ncbi:MAG: exodeoxyribonuclease VII small subunit [Bacteroidaceae bacterium]
MKIAKNITYEDALKQLEEIVSMLESGQLSIDILTEKLAQAEQLLTFCKAKLTHTNAEVKKILENMQ